MCYWEGSVVTNVLAAWLLGITVEIFLLISPRRLGSGPEHEDAEDKQDGQPHLQSKKEFRKKALPRRRAELHANNSQILVHLCPFALCQDDRLMKCPLHECLHACTVFIGHTFPTEVECSCTSSRKFPSKLQSAMAVWSVLFFRSPVLL